MIIFPIDSEEKELCCLCVLGIVHYDYMAPSAKTLYDTLTKEEIYEIKEKFKRADD